MWMTTVGQILAAAGGKNAHFINLIMKGNKSMKKLKSIKFLILALSAALLLSSMVLVIASANTGSEKPEIYAANLNMDGDYSIAFAVDAQTVKSGSIKVQAKDGDTVIREYISSKIESVKLNGVAKDCYTVVTHGIAQKDVAKDFTFVVYDGETAGDSFTFSVAKYFYLRLFRDGIADASSGLDAAQKDFYIKNLAACATAQNLFYNFNDNDNDNIDVLVDALKMCVINGTPALYDSTKTVTLPEYTGAAPEGKVFAGYSVSTYDSSYIKTTADVAVGDIITVSSHTVVTPVFENKLQHAGGAYYNDSTYAGTRYDFDTTNPTVKNEGNLGTENLNDGESGYIYLHKNGVPGNSNYLRINGTDVNVKDENKITVFEADVNFVGIVSNQSTPIKFYIERGTGFGQRATFYIATDENGKVYFRMGDWNTIANLNTDSSEKLLLNQNQWYNLRIEFDNDGMTKFFVNGEHLSTVQNTLGTSSNSTSIFLYMQDYAGGKPVDNHGLYIDNLFINSACEPSETE